MRDLFDGLPGAAHVERGLEDLAEGRETARAWLVSCAARRLRRAGLDVPAMAPAVSRR